MQRVAMGIWSGDCVHSHATSGEGGTSGTPVPDTGTGPGTGTGVHAAASRDEAPLQRQEARGRGGGAAEMIGYNFLAETRDIERQLCAWTLEVASGGSSTQNKAAE